MKIFIMLKSNR